MPNYCIIPARALQDPTLKGTDIRVLCAIGGHTHPDGDGCIAHSRTLCKEARVHRSQFFASTKRLIAAGLIKCASGQAAGKGSRYSIIFDVEGASTKRGRGVPESSTPGVHDSDTQASTNAGRRRPRKQDGPTINGSSNVSFNAPANDGGGIDLDTEGRTLFSQIRRSKLEVRSPNGTHYRIPPEVIASLTPRVQGVIDVIGGLGAIANVDANNERHLRTEFAKVYAATSRQRTA